VKLRLGSKFWQLFLIVSLVGLSGFLGILGGYHWATGELPFVRHQVILPPVTQTNVTSSQVSTFLSTDNTSLQEYREGFNCVESALMAARNAVWDGIPAEVVRLVFVDNTSHMMLVFPTNDSGWIFVEPQTDSIVYPQVGTIYMGSKVSELDLLNLSWVSMESN
jgi:hypothetical protein